MLELVSKRVQEAHRKVLLMCSSFFELVVFSLIGPDCTHSQTHNQGRIEQRHQAKRCVCWAF